jgi:hypothetical protein
MAKRELWDATFTLVAETEKAILVTEDGGKTKSWLPKSQIEYDKVGETGVEVTMPIWLAKEKGFAGV